MLIVYRCQRELMAAKDVRMKRTNEILVGMKYIKMCGTEDKFLEIVRQLYVWWINILLGDSG